MSEIQPTNFWDFQSHPEWQGAFDNNGTDAAHERHEPSPAIVVDMAKLSADALRLTQLAVGRRELDQSA